MVDIFFWTVAATAFAAAGTKARGLRRSAPPPGLGSTCLLLTTVGLALVLLSSGAQQVENTLYPNLGRLLSNLCTTVAAFAALAHVLCITRPPSEARARIRRWRLALLVAVTAMSGLFVSSHLPPVIDFGSLYRDHPTLVGYVLIYVVFSGWALTVLAITAVRYARPAARPALRAGLRLVSLGCVLGIVYLVEKAGVVVTQALRLRPLLSEPAGLCPSPLHPPRCLFSVGFPALTVLAITIGMTLPAWGPAAAAPARWLQYRRTYRRLNPLWLALTTAMPQIVLPRSGRDRFSYRYGVHRRVIEIRDGLLLLGPYRDADAGSQVATTAGGDGLDPHQEAALREADSVRRALTAYQSGRPTEGRILNLQPTERDSKNDLQDKETLNGGTGNDLDSEADWLMRVSSAFSVSASPAENLAKGTRPGGR